MQKKSFQLATVTHSNSTRTIENVNAAEKRIQETMFPVPPSEEVVARLNAIAREYPFCAYLKHNNSTFLL
jgi:hypothetical protein